MATGKWISMMVLSAMLIQSTTYASGGIGQNNGHETSGVDKKQEKTVKEVVWEHEGTRITVFTDHALTEQEKKNFEYRSRTEQVEALMGKPSVITPESEEGETGATTIYGPVNRSYDNTVTTDIVLTVVNAIQYGTPALVYALTKNAIASLAIAAANTFFDKIKDELKASYNVYVSYKTSKAWSSYYGAYEVFDTLVVYTDQYRNRVKDVFYYSTGVTTN